MVVDGLEPGTSSEYTVAIDGERVWPPTDPAHATLPQSRISTLDPHEPTRLAFGSCRTSVPHDAEGNASNGVDALRAYARHLSRTEPAEWPHLVAFLGDQVYADETSEEMREFIASRRSLDEPPGEELKDYEEYAHLYRLAWTDPLNRWLLSTLPSTMIFDDHDIRDDWNTSQQWHREMNAKPWWHDRIVGGLASYWVYQHAGNLSPDDLATDEIWQLIADHAAAGREDELDLTDTLDAFAERVDKDRTPTGGAMPETSASPVWSWWTPGPRGCSSPAGARSWTTTRWTGSTASCAGTWTTCSSAPRCRSCWPRASTTSRHQRGDGDRGVGSARRPPRGADAPGLDLEHWAAFQEGFAKVLDMVVEVAEGKRGRPPGTITFLSATCTTRTSPRSTARSSGPAPAASCRRSAPRSATRCRAGSGSLSRCSPAG